jgi:hypothetical protein
MSFSAVRFIQCAVIIATCAAPASAAGGIPLMKDFADAQTAGPHTQPLDLKLYQQVLYVGSAAGAGAGDADGSKQRPYPQLQAALDHAANTAPDARCAILVSAGTYEVVDLQMKQHVDLFGGFDSSWQRDILKNQTILDARQHGVVIRGADQATLDGFEITGGRSDRAGGAIVCEHSSPTISNNILRGNATHKPADFRMDMIHQRGADGGAIAVTFDARPIIRNNLICQNTTGIGNGGGIFVWNHCAPQILGNVIIDNHTGLEGREYHEGSRSSNGGGIAVSLDCAPVITGNVIAMNTTVDNSDGGGIYLEYDANAQIRGNWIVGNFGQDDGGGMYIMKNSQPVVERNIFAGNANTSGGSGAIRLSKEGRLLASHNLIVANPNDSMDVVSSWMQVKYNTFVDSGMLGIIFENRSPHYASSEIIGNLFAGKVKAAALIKPGVPHPPIITGNVVAAGAEPLGEGNSVGDPNFIDDSLRLGQSSGKYDPALAATTFELDAAKLPPNLAGRVLRVGKHWTVIESNDATHLTAWGDLSTNPADLLVLGTYQLPKDSPSAPFGAYAPGEQKK